MNHINPGRWIAEHVFAIIHAAPINEDYLEGEQLPMEPGDMANLRESRLPRVDLEKLPLGERRLFITDRARSSKSAGRSPRVREITVQVMLIQKLNSELDDLEALIELMYAIDELLATQTRLGWISSDNQPIYDPDLLHTQHTFRSVLTCTFINTH